MLFMDSRTAEISKLIPVAIRHIINRVKYENDVLAQQQNNQLPLGLICLFNDLTTLQ
jgi:hypothetical protein